MDDIQDLRVARLEMFQHLWFLQENELETGQHTYKGSEIRHRVIERLIYHLKETMKRILGEDFDRMWRGILYLPFTFAFGLNCNYSLKVVCGYAIWWVYYQAKDLHWR